MNLPEPGRAKTKSMTERRLLCKVLTFSRVINYLSYLCSIFLSRILRREILLNQPWAITIEASSVCQLACPECPAGNGNIVRKQPFMSQEDFESVLSGLSPKTFYLNLYFQGEPLLDLGLIQKIEAARRQKMFVSLSSNAQMIDSSMAEQLIQSGIQKLIVSLDGTDQATYETYRTNGDIQQVFKALNHLVQAQQKLKINTPVIEVQMLIFRYNEHQIAELKNAAKAIDRKIGLVYKAPQFYSEEKATLWMPESKRYQRYKRMEDNTVKPVRKTPRFCVRLWSTIVVTSDVMVVPCCYDKFASHELGSLKNEKAASLWRGRLYRRFRREWLSGRTPAMCQNCF